MCGDGSGKGRTDIAPLLEALGQPGVQRRDERVCICRIRYGVVASVCSSLGLSWTATDLDEWCYIVTETISIGEFAVYSESRVGKQVDG